MDIELISFLEVFDVSIVKCGFYTGSTLLTDILSLGISALSLQDDRLITF